MSKIARMMQQATAGAGGAGLDVDEVFSTYLYDGTGTGSNLTVTNNIDLSTEGGLVWVKNRDATAAHALFDTVRGQNILESQSSGGQDAFSAYGGSASASYNTNGFGINGTGASNLNQSGVDYTSWTFRKAPKFCDIVTYTGDGTNGRQISHNLGHDVGMMLIKKTSSSDDWRVFHRSQSNKYAALNSTFQFQTDGGNIFGNPSNGTATAPTSTHFTVANDASVNQSSATYVAYLFAHNDGDGEFGPNADQDVIKCGSYTGDGGAGTTEVNLGFEPQWILVKASSATDNWFIIDNMRGWATHNNEANDAYLLPNATNSESTGGFLDITSTGFKTTLYSNVNVSGREYIYMAIRRGPLAEPTSASDVFGSLAYTGNGASTREFTVGSAVSDMLLQMCRSSSTYNYPNIGSRLTGKGINTSSSASEIILAYDFDKMDGVHETGFENTLNQSSETYIMHSWKRAPGYFDVVAYSGTGSNTNLGHNLSAVPEMIWWKKRSASGSDWIVYHKDLTSGSYPSGKSYLFLNSNSATSTPYQPLTSAPTSSVLPLSASSGSNASSSTYIAFLFATVAGVSKVGSFSHTNGSTTDVDCGFTGDTPSFVLLKRYNTTGSWVVFDSTRGIVAGNDPFLKLDTTDAETTGNDVIDPLSGGFQVASGYLATGDWIFYAIA